MPPRHSPPSQGQSLAILGAITVLLAAVGWYLWQNTRPFSVSFRLYPTASTAAPSPPPATSGGAAPSLSPRPDIPIESVDSDPESTLPVLGPTRPPRLEVYPGTLGWEAQIDALLKENVPDGLKAERLLSRAPSLPEEAYARVAQEAVDRLPDADYAKVALPLVTKAETHGSMASVLFADLLERPDDITLPALLAVARQPDHPYADSARENLELLLGERHQQDWAAWEQAVQRQLQR